MKKNILKNIALLLPFLALIIGCEIKEEPPLADKDKLYGSNSSKVALINGVYEELVGFGSYKQSFLQVSTHGSGFFSSKQRPLRQGVCAFNIDVSDGQLIGYWDSSFRIINRVNTIISDLEELETLDSADVFNRDVYGHMHFIRAFQYFNLVRQFGPVPLRLEESSAENIHVGRTPKKDIYDQIIKDATTAINNMSIEGISQAYPIRYAANMLLSKVYMSLASAADSNDPNLAIPGYTDSGINYWDSAYVQAVEVEGKYSLVPNYYELFQDKGNHTSESIFELNLNSEIALVSYTAQFTPFEYTRGLNNYGRINVAPEVFIRHQDTHPNDPRLKISYIGESFSNFYRNAQTGEVVQGTMTLFIDDELRLEQTVAAKCYPYLKKHCLTNQEQLTMSSPKGYTLYRYADLLLMLAEIQNERGDLGSATMYLDRVLSRARQSSYVDQNGNIIPGNGVNPETPTGLNKDSFRERIFNERYFELLGEGEDWYEARRRGYNWLNTHIIQPHNNFKYFNPAVDTEIREDERGMLLPLPQIEINNNQLISKSDQNPGY